MEYDQISVEILRLRFDHIPCMYVFLVGLKVLTVFFYLEPFLERKPSVFGSYIELFKVSSDEKPEEPTDKYNQSRIGKGEAEQAVNRSSLTVRNCCVDHVVV